MRTERAVILAGLVAWALPLDGCDWDGGGAPRDGASADASADAFVDGAPPADGGGVDARPDAPSDAAVNDDACPTANPADEDCTAGVVCRYGDAVCECAAYCGGAFDPDAGSSWQCVSRPPACPGAAPTDGAGCSDDGLTCDYGTCGQTHAACDGATWDVEFYPPPP